MNSARRHTTETSRLGGTGRWLLFMSVLIALVLCVGPMDGLAKSMPAGFMMHEDAAKHAIATHHSPPPKSSLPTPAPTSKVSSSSKTISSHKAPSTLKAEYNAHEDRRLQVQAQQVRQEQRQAASKPKTEATRQAVDQREADTRERSRFGPE